MSDNEPNQEQDPTPSKDPSHEETKKPNSGSSSGQNASERWIEVFSTLLLAIVVVVTAWSGYQSTRWNGEQADDFIQASGTRVESERASTLAGQDRLYDLILFNNWLNAHTNNQTQLTTTFERRFRDEFRPVFAKWLATDPFNNPNAPAGPLLMPEYHLAESDKADKLEKDAQDKLEEGRLANQVSDDYVLVTVFLAIVLFFVAIAERFKWTAIRWVVLILGLGMLILGLAKLTTLPIN